MPNRGSKFELWTVVNNTYLNSDVRDFDFWDTCNVASKYIGRINWWIQRKEYPTNEHFLWGFPQWEWHCSIKADHSMQVFGLDFLKRKTMQERDSFFNNFVLRCNKIHIYFFIFLSVPFFMFQRLEYILNKI